MASKKKLFDKYIEKVSQLNRDKHLDEIYLSLLKGKSSYLRYHRYESSLFDASWIDVVEDCLYDLGEIVSNPRQVTKQESNVVPVELAKKIDGESVQHLASHTQYIKEVDDANNVVPSKILSHSNEDNMNTYENRFIATFIRRLVLFIEKRYEYIQNMIPLHMEDVLYMKSDAEVNGEIVEIETKIRVKKESDDDIAISANGYIERIMKMREYIFYYYNSPFMKKLKNEKDVRKPILQTNIIRKNPKYNKCYRTFMFIERFSSLGVNYKVDESYKEFSDKDLAELNYLFLSNYLAMQNQEEIKTIKSNSKTYKPKILTSIDDEIFTFGEPLTGTLEFVRVDEEYREYLNSRGNIALPLHPNKYEKLYFKGEYQLRKECKKELLEIEKLLRRKIRENEDWEKYVEEVLKVVEEENREAERLRLMQIASEELALIEKKRQEIIAAAKTEKKDRKSNKKAQEETPTISSKEDKPVQEDKKEEPKEDNKSVGRKPSKKTKKAQIETKVESPSLVVPISDENAPKMEEHVIDEDLATKENKPIINEELEHNEVEVPVVDVKEVEAISSDDIKVEDSTIDEPKEDVQEEVQPVEESPVEEAKAEEPVQEESQEESAQQEQPVVEEQPVEENPSKEQPKEENMQEEANVPQQENNEPVSSNEENVEEDDGNYREVRPLSDKEIDEFLKHEDFAYKKKE